MKFEVFETKCDLGQESVKGGPFGNLWYLEDSMVRLATFGVCSVAPGCARCILRIWCCVRLRQVSGVVVRLRPDSRFAP